MAEHDEDGVVVLSLGVTSHHCWEDDETTNRESLRMGRILVDDGTLIHGILGSHVTWLMDFFDYGRDETGLME